jgi:peptide/nickel transport system permease protein
VVPGLILIYVFAYRLRQDFGIALFLIANTDYHPLDLAGLALPALTLALALAPFYIRITRAVMIEELHRHYVRTARAKGVSDDGVGPCSSCWPTSSWTSPTRSSTPA